jgi:death-on-curing family protein
MLLFPSFSRNAPWLLGYRDRSTLDSAVLRPFQTAFQKEIYPTIEEKGALFHAINTGHAFIDGNKRTSIIALEHFLVANGYFLAIGQQEMHDLAVQTASYRERGASSDQSYGEVLNAMVGAVVHIREFLKTDVDSYRSLRRVHFSICSFK